MALRDQPYLPLYVQDFMTDERLNECSAESTGVYIRLMCVMHKSQNYGEILLKQKDKQTDSKIHNFSLKLTRQMPYQVEVIENALNELLEEKVIILDGDRLYQKRMVKDGKLSDTRAFAGKQNRKNSKRSKLADDFALAKTAASSEYEYEDENDNENEGEIETEVKGAGAEIVKLPVIKLPLNTGEEYPIFPEQAEEWAGLYPAVDVIQQLREMRGWLSSHPTKRKTRRGVLAFVTGWLGREQDKGGSVTCRQGIQHQQQNAMDDLLELHRQFEAEELQ